MTYNVGEKVTIREWDDMAVEFGLDEDGDIQTPVEPFVEKMKGFCGKELTVELVLGFAYVMEGDDGRWYFVDEMIAHGRQ